MGQDGSVLPPRRSTVSRTASVVALLLTLGACSTGHDTSVDPSGDSSQPPASATEPPPASPSEKLGLTEGWGPDRAELDRAAAIAGRMPLPDLAGQVIVAQWSGTRAPVALVRRLHLGGVIAFDTNATSARQITAVNRQLTRQVPRRWPLFLGVDQEGGVVERLRAVATRFPTFMSAGAAGDPTLTRTAYGASGAELRGLGFTVNFAPDADVTSGPHDPTIGSRSASSNPALVAEQTVAAAEGFMDAGVVPVLKHFPGHGSVPADSHLTLPVQHRTRAQLDKADLVPFRAAVGAGLPAVMTGHLDVRAIDPRVPSSLSHAVITDLLRHEMGFGGLVVTDALNMVGVTRGRDEGRTAVQAIRAGSDVLLMPPSPDVARAALIRAVRTGSLPRRRLEQAAARQIALLSHIDGGAGARIGSARASSQELSAAAVTMLSGSCSGRLVKRAVAPTGNSGAVGAFVAAARRGGLPVFVRRSAPRGLSVARREPRRGRKEGRQVFRKRHRVWRLAEAGRTRRLERWQSRERTRVAGATSVALIGFHGAPLDAEVVVATDSPWVLGQVRAPVRIATYADTPGAMDALVEVLLGRAPAPGKLPVQVPGVQRRGCG